MKRTVRLLPRILPAIFLMFLFFSSREVPQEQAWDFFQKNGGYFTHLPVRYPDSCAQHIKNEVPKKWQFIACQSLYYILPSQGAQDFSFEHLNSFDKTFPSDSMRAFTQMIRGELYTYQNRFDSARKCLQESFDLNKKLERLADAGDAQRFLARIHLHEGDFPESIRLLLEALELYEKNEAVYNNNRYFNIRLDLAHAYIASLDYQEALKWNQSAWDYAQTVYGTQGFKIIAAANLAQNYIYLNRPDSALVLARKALDLHYFYRHFYNIDEQHYTLAQAYQATGDCETALSHYRQATCCISPDANRVKFFKYDQATADCYLCLGKLDSARFFYQKCLASPDTAALAEVHAGLSQIYRKSADLRRALFHADESRRLHDAAFNAGKARIIGNLNLKFASAQQERRIGEIKQEQKISHQQNVIVFLLMALALGFALFLVVRQRSRQELLEQDKKLLNKKNQLAEIRAKLQAQELERSQADLFKKEEELRQSSQALLLKNEWIAELEIRLSQQTDEPSAPVDAVAEINALHRMKILTEADWQRFRQRFDEQFPGFLVRLKTAFPNLTTSEMRLFLLLKLGFDTKEMTGVLGISIDSVWKNRYRLKKKIGLSDGDDLDGFVQGFR